MRSSATGSTPWRRRSGPANRCSSISRCISSRAASRTAGSMPRSSRTAPTSRTTTWLPAIGYQADRELRSAGERRAYGLAARPAIASARRRRSARGDTRRAARIAFEAVVGTDEGQVAVAPGRLRRTWTEDGRRYFHYATDAPIRNDYAFFSAAYAVHEGRWNDVSIRDLSSSGPRVERGPHGPKRTGVARLLHAAVRPVPARPAQARRAPRRRRQLARLSGQHLVRGRVLSAEPGRRSAGHRSSLRGGGARGGAQWWGATLTPARVEGAAVLTESLAWYSALQVVERTFGREHLRRLLSMMREVYVTPRTRADVPLLRATDSVPARTARARSRCTRCASTSAPSR